MHDLWQATRIRRDEYGWLGDLRALPTRATMMLDVKTTWARPAGCIGGHNGHLIPFRALKASGLGAVP